MPAKEENQDQIRPADLDQGAKPGCIKFLNPAEQIKVEKLLLEYTKEEGKEKAIQTEMVNIDTVGIGPCNCVCKGMFSDIQCKLDKILSMMAVYSVTNPVAVVDLNEIVPPISPKVLQPKLTSPDPIPPPTFPPTNTPPLSTSVNSISLLENYILPVDHTSELSTSDTSATIISFNTSSTLPNPTSDSSIASLKSTPSSILTSHAQTTPPFSLNNPSSAIYEDTYKESTSLGELCKKPYV